MKIWECDSPTPSGTASDSLELAYTPESRLVSIEMEQRALRLRVSDARGGMIEKRPLSLPGEFAGSTLRPDGRQFALANTEGRVLLGGLDSPTKDLGLIAPAAEVITLRLSRDGRTLAATGMNATVKLWDIANGRPIREWTQPAMGTIGLDFSPDGRQIASTSLGSPVTAWELTTGNLLFQFGGIQPGNTGKRSADIRVTYSPDGRFLLGDTAGAVPCHLLDAHSGTFLRELAGNAGRLHALAFSPDGSRLAGAMEDHSVRIWDTTSGQETLALKGHENSVTAVAWSPDGRILVSAGQGGALRVWDSTDGTVMQDRKR